MNLEGARVVLRPRTQSEIFDLAFRFCAALALPLYLRLAAIVLLPCLLACGYVHRLSDGEWPVTWAVALALGAFAQSVFTVAASRLLFEPHPRVLGVVLTTLRRLPALFGALLLHACLLGAGAFVAIGSFFVWVWHTYLYEAVLLEQQGPIGAISRASALIKHKFGAALVTCIGGATVVALGILSAELLLGSIVEWVLQLGEPFGALYPDGGSPYALIGYFAALPLVATARFLSYIDGRTRQDGWDIQLRFMSIAAGDPDPDATSEEATP
jgi:hypothetical protein